MSSKLFNTSQIPNTPKLPDVFYYDSAKKEPAENSSTVFQNNMSTSCTNPNWNDTTKTKCLFDNKPCDEITNYARDGSLRNNYTATAGGDQCNPVNNPTINDIYKQVQNKCPTPTGQQAISNQLQYLSCQLAIARTRLYNSNNFDFSSQSTTIAEIFKKFPKIKLFLIIIFYITIYLLLSGFFSSLDIGCNILDKISEVSVVYWVGLLLGLALPFIILIVLFQKSFCENIVGDNKYEITTTPDGQKVTVSDQNRSLDYSLIIIFIAVIFGFTALLFTVKRRQIGDTLYIIITGGIFVIISIFVYLFYAFTPYFVTANQNDIMKPGISELKLYIDEKDDTSHISTNQEGNTMIRKLFTGVFIAVFILTILYFINSKYYNGENGFINSFKNGFLAASAILILPMIWVFNYIIGIKYFFVYPILLITLRFFRYIGMFLLYMATERNSDLKNNFSDDLVEQLDNIKNYSPSWSLAGIGLLKAVMNMVGYDNIFSKEFVNENNTQKNVAQDKYVFSLLILRLLMKEDAITSSKKGIVFGALIVILTIIIASIILFGIVKVQKITGSS
jgi:hypothetical protein